MRSLKGKKFHDLDMNLVIDIDNPAVVCAGCKRLCLYTDGQHIQQELLHSILFRLSTSIEIRTLLKQILLLLIQPSV